MLTHRSQLQSFIILPVHTSLFNRSHTLPHPSTPTMSIVYNWQNRVKVELLKRGLCSWIIPLEISGDEAAGGEEPDKEVDQRAWKVWLMDYCNGRLAIETSLGQYGEVITQDPRYTELPQWCPFLKRYRALESLLREQVAHSSVSYTHSLSPSCR